jgi:hypothetical protein
MGGMTLGMSGTAGGISEMAFGMSGTSIRRLNPSISSLLFGSYQHASKTAHFPPLPRKLDFQAFTLPRPGGE